MTMTGKKTVKLWKYSGIFLIATGILHTIYGFALSIKGKYYLWDMFEYGLSYDGGIFPAILYLLTVWSLSPICGIILIILGHVLHYYIKKEQTPIPIFIGYYFLGLFVVGLFIAMPVPCFWLLFPQALIVLFANRKH